MKNRVVRGKYFIDVPLGGSDINLIIEGLSLLHKKSSDDVYIPHLQDILKRHQKELVQRLSTVGKKKD